MGVRSIDRLFEESLRKRMIEPEDFWELVDLNRDLVNITGVLWARVMDLETKCQSLSTALVNSTPAYPIVEMLPAIRFVKPPRTMGSAQMGVSEATQKSPDGRIISHRQGRRVGLPQLHQLAVSPELRGGLRDALIQHLQESSPLSPPGSQSSA
jgi:hypothetical protein